MTEALNEKNPFEGWTTLQEAARLLGRDGAILRYWAKKGYIQCYEVAPKVRLVNFEEVRAYAQEHKPHTSG
jgi:predicted site-specific integrase-resolvase